MRKICLFVFCLLFQLFFFGCNGDKNEVVMYCSMDQEYAQIVADRFTKKTGINVRCRFDEEATKTLGLVQRLRSETANPQADVFWSSEAFETIRLAKDNILAPYESTTTKAWPAEYRDAGNRWYGFALRARVLAYNTTRVKKEDIPGSIEDLLKPRWKGKVLMARPQFGSTRGHVAAIWLTYGPEGAERIFRGLKENKIRVVNGNSTAVRMLAQGEADACLTDTDDIWVAQRNGWPVGIVYPRHGRTGTLIFPNTAALVRGSPHPKEAGQLIDFLLSEEVEEILVKSDSHNIPVREALARQFPQYKVPDPMTIDYGKVAGVMNDAVRSAVKILGN